MRLKSVRLRKRVEQRGGKQGQMGIRKDMKVSGATKERDTKEEESEGEDERGMTLCSHRTCRGTGVSRLSPQPLTPSCSLNNASHVVPKLSILKVANLG